MKLAIYTGLVIGIVTALVYASIVPLKKDETGSTYAPLPEQTYNPQETINSRELQQ